MFGLDDGGLAPFLEAVIFGPGTAGAFNHALGQLLGAQTETLRLQRRLGTRKSLAENEVLM